MKENIARVKTFYTYGAAVKRYEEERHHAWLCNQKKLKSIRREQQERRKYFCNQKLYGLLIAMLSVILLVLTQETLLIIGMAAGVFLTVTKQMVIYNEYFRTHGGTEQWKI